MESTTKIRKIAKNDVEFIYNSLCNLEDEVFDFKEFEEIFNENIVNPNHLYLIAENGLDKIGFVTFHVQYVLHHCGLVGEIQEFYISLGYRGKGVGRQLISEVMDFAEQNKLKSIEVTTNKKRIENIAIYENLGFTLTHNKFTIYK